MWEDYAKEIGVSTNDLTQAQKIQAEYNGIMEETRFQVGDAAAYTKTFSGQVQQLKFNFTQMTAAIGKVVAPIAQLFIPVLNAAMQAVTNLFQSLQNVLKVFGLDMPDVVSKTSSAVSGVSADIESTGDSAVSAAKKINKAFAGVDEINVLKTSDSSSSGSDTSTGSTNTAISVTPASDDTISTAVSATVEKIRKYIEPLQNINFDNLVNAFQKLKDAIKPLTSKLFDGLSWAYFNLLVPLAQWTIEDVLPTFLNLFSGALKVLNPILESFSNIFTPVWNNLLKPFLSWTGNAIVGVLESVASALSKIGDWMSENQGVVDAIVIALTTFFGLWKATELMSFIAQAGGVTKALKLMTGEFWKNIAAKIQDKKDTIVLTALYAKDFIVGLANSTKQLITQVAQWIAMTAAKVADTAATTAATVATWAFNAAMIVLTSPITLVVLAITALITIITLLIKNWDSVKEAASACWDWIVGVFQGAAEWFNTTIIQPISNFFTGMWDGLKNGASAAWEGIKSVFSTVADFFKNIFTNAWEGVKAVFSTGGKIFDGIKDGIVKAFTTVVNAIIKGINKVVSIPFDGINWALKKIKGIDILGVKPFNWIKTISVPQIPLLAQGGWFDRGNPQLAIVGDNTREPEIVTPESKIYDQVRNAIRDSGGTGKQEIEITIYHKYEDGRTIIQKINQAQIDAGQVLVLS